MRGLAYETSIFAVSAALLTGAAAKAQTQTEPRAAEPAEAAASSVAEIVVTAQKRAQALTDVGISISVVDQAQIAQRRIEAVTDLVSFTPNVSIKETAPGLVPVITIRGVGLDDFSATNNPSAGVYVDEVFLSSLALMNFDLFDVERMEVLKGPQGTLYGRNSTAGALNILSAKPTFKSFSSQVGGSIGNYESRDVEGMVNIPVSDTLAFRIAGKGVFQDEGFYYDRLLGRDIGRRSLWLGRLQARWRPTDKLDVLVKVEGQRGRSELGQSEFFGATPTTPPTPGVTCPGRPQCADLFGYRDTDNDPFKGDWSVDPRYDLNQINVTTRVEADLGFGKLTSVTGYINFDRTWGIDTDAGPRRQSEFITTDKVRQISQELRLAGSAPIVDWLVGAFYSGDHITSVYAGSLQDLFNTTTRTSSDQHTYSAAGFANGEWRLTDTLRLVTGLRYTSESRRNVGGTFDLVSQPPGSFVSGAPFGSPPVPLATVDARISDQNWSYKAGLNWKPAPRTLVYASVSQGVKSGGFFAGVATSSAQLQPYSPERLVAYEVGVKRGMPDIGLNISGSGFYYDYNDVQTFIRDTSGSLPIQRLGNVSKAEIYGFDGDIAFSPRPIPGLTLGAALGLLHSRLGAFASSSGPVPAGNRLPDAPTFSLDLNAAYQIELSRGLAARVAVDGRRQSYTFKDALNDPLIASDPFWVWNARVSLLREGDWDVSGWVKNLADERYTVQGINQLVLGFGYRVYGAPRTYGVSATKRF